MGMMEGKHKVINGSGSPRVETPRSPEAMVGMHVEDLWDVQEPQLTPTEKLNACFESIPVSDFPPAPSSQVLEIKSDTSVAEAVKLLSSHRILGAPVVDVEASDDASWIDRYIGIVEFAGIVVWILHQSFAAHNKNVLNELLLLQSEKMEGLNAPGVMTSFSEDSFGPAVAAAAANSMSSPRYRSSHPESPTATAGNFFEALTSSDLYKNTKVRDIAGSFRWAPFLALQTSNSFLTMLLLLSKYRMKSIPVVDVGESKINNIITQASVIHMLEECSGLPWFESLGSKKLSDLGLPLMGSNRIVKVYEDEPVLQAFKLMREKGVGGVPIIEQDGTKAVDSELPETMFTSCRSITAKNFLSAVKKYLEGQQKDSLTLSGLVTCKRSATLNEVIVKLDEVELHRIYVVDDHGNLEGVITLRDIISKLVHEPRGYFGDFFDGVLPLPANSRV
ncbi:hypothetical protein Leryth_006643 [Lithospermum erythrorhizon]|nr:hypothetical protein Leryth_006643 [Lithospermum erythrorhizon]